MIDIRITQPGSFDRRGRWNPPRSKSRRERWLHPPDIDNGDDVCLPRESRVEKMYEAVRKDDRTPDVASADKHERPPPWSANVFLKDPCEVRVAPVVHVIVSGTRHAVPVDRWIAEQHSKPLLNRQRRVDGANVGEHLLIHRQRPNAANLRRLFPRSFQHVARDSFAGDITVDDSLIASVSKLDNDVVDLAGEAWLTNEPCEKIL